MTGAGTSARDTPLRWGHCPTENPGSAFAGRDFFSELAGVRQPSRL